LTEGFGEEENLTRDFFLAQLTEVAGEPAKALAMYRALLAQRTSFETEIKAGINRTKPTIEKGVSETSLIIEQAKTADGALRVKLIRSLSRADVDVSEVLPALVSWAQDANLEVVSAACETLVHVGHAAVPKVIPLLSSDQRQDVMNAAVILGKIGLEPTLVVPALGKALENPDAEVRGKVVDALANFGPEAAPAVTMLRQTLAKTVQSDLQKQIAYTLGEIGPPAKESIPQLVELLKSGKDREGFLSVTAAVALGKIGPSAETAVPALMAALKSDDARLATVSAEALGNIGAGAQAAIPALIEAMRFTEKEHRENQAEPLGKIAEALANKGDTSALPALKKAKQSMDAANIEPKYITPIREAVVALEEKESRNRGGKY
jgi:HEAT repeat protein